MNSFAQPLFLGLLLLIPIWLLFRLKQKRNTEAVLQLSTIQKSAIKQNWKTKTRPYLFVLKIFSFICLIIALARPQEVEKSNFTSFKNGIDIVIATDVSGSMLATDLQPNRLEAIKTVATDFIKNRPNDRIGLVVYAGESYTKAPVTSDKLMVLNALSEVQYNGMVLQDGTAIGIGLATAVNRLKESKSKTKIIILLTDGVNNVGSLDPITAAEIAKEFNIRVYTIGVGTNGVANFPYAKDANGNIVFQKQKVEIDEKLMQQIAKITNGKYFRATSNDKLTAIYEEIDSLEKSVIKEEVQVNFNEIFRFWAILALVFLLLEFILKQTIYKSFI